MKRVRIYQQIISDENLRLAIDEVNRGHRRNGDHSLNRKVLEIEANKDEYVKKLRAYIEALVTGEARMHKPLQRRKWDRNADSGKGKWRDINEPLLWPDQYVHHAVVQPMIPHIRRSMDKYCIASVPGRGNSYGVKALKKWMKNDPAGTQYCAECDIFHCFVEVNPMRVIEALKRVFKDRETLWLCDAMMEYGVLIGAFFSSWFLHLLLQPLDLMIHQKRYGVSHYLRQMDNFTIFGSNKRKLKKAAGGHSGVAGRGRAEAEGELADLPHGLYAEGGQSPRGPAGEEAAASASKAPIRAGIPFRAWIYDPPKAQPVSAQTGAAHLLSQKRPGPGHLIQEGVRFDLTTGAAAKMQQSANIGTALPTENHVRFEESRPKGMSAATTTIPALSGGMKGVAP